MCSNCAKVGTNCSRPPEWEGQSRSYTRALEDQVAYLETRLRAVEQQQGDRFQPRPDAHHLVQGPTTERVDRTAHYETSGGTLPQFGHDVADVVGMLSLGRGNLAQSYVGSSSGYAMATDLGRMVQATVWNKALYVSASSGSEEVSAPPGEHVTRRITLQELQSEQAEPPPDILGRKLIQAYLIRIHPRFPFLFRPDVWEAHRCRYALQCGRQEQLNDDPPSFSSPAYKDDGFALFVLNMVYAIGALNIRLTEDYKDTSPEQFYVFAMQHVASVRKASSIHNLEATVLLILYHLRSESRNGLWHLTGLAMRTVTDIGLHREASTKTLPPFEAQLRRRLFWSVYALESILAGTLGRPISLSDCDIDQPLPFSIDDDDRMRSMCTEDLQVAPGQEAYPPTNMSQFILLSKIHIFEARIQRNVYRVDRKIGTLQPKMHRLMTDLEAWRHTIPPSIQARERDRVMLHYHRAVRLLLQPFLAILEPESEHFRTCADAAGQICQIHKRLHQTPGSEYGHSFVAVHTVFVSGITLLYTLWRGRDNVWSFAISNDIRAASCVLSIMGERAPWIRPYRDTFDVMVEATMATLQGEGNNHRSPAEELCDPGSAAPVVDFSIFEDLQVAGNGALDMARELAEWF
jgi:hypothetical protein